MEEESIEPREYSTEMFNPPDTTVETIYKTMKAMLLSIGLNVLNLWGHCFGGVANISDGVKKKKFLFTIEINLRALFSNHCS